MVLAQSRFPALDAEGRLVVDGVIATSDTASNLASTVPAAGEIVHAADTGKLVVGDGSTTFANLTDLSLPKETEVTVYRQDLTLELSDGANYLVNVENDWPSTSTLTIPDPVRAGQRLTVLLTASDGTAIVDFSGANPIHPDGTQNDSNDHLEVTTVHGGALHMVTVRGDSILAEATFIWLIVNTYGGSWS